MSFHSLTPPLSSTPFPNFAAFGNVIVLLVTHPSHVGWQLSHLPAVTRCNGDKHLTTAQSFFGLFVLEVALYKGWVGGTNQGGRTPHIQRRKEGLEVALAIKLHLQAQSS